MTIRLVKRPGKCCHGVDVGYCGRMPCQRWQQRNAWRAARGGSK